MRSFGFHSRFMGIFWKRRSRRRLTNEEKSSKVHKAFFDRKKSAPIIQGMVQGVLGGGENPFSPHEFFYFFYFLLSKFECHSTSPNRRPYHRRPLDDSDHAECEKEKIFSETEDVIQVYVTVVTWQ